MELKSLYVGAILRDERPQQTDRSPRIYEYLGTTKAGSGPKKAEFTYHFGRVDSGVTIRLTSAQLRERFPILTDAEGDPDVKTALARSIRQQRPAQDILAEMRVAKVAARKEAIRPVTLVLSQDEAQAVRDVLCRIAGCPENSRRRYTEAVLAVLENLGFCHPPGSATDIDTTVSNGIRFLSPKETWDREFKKHHYDFKV